MAFHEILFPTNIAYGSSGGPTRKTEVITLDSGYEQRNSPWSASRHMYNIAYGMKSYDDLHTVKKFWEARTGALNGFRYRDFADYTSLGPSDTPTKSDQTISTTAHPANGSNTVFQLIKVYSDSQGSYTRTINKPVSGTVLIANNGTLKTETTDYTIDYTTGLVTFGTAPVNGHTITAGFEFDVPVRFQDDVININLADYLVGNFDPILLIEIRV
jgi:uncharacterized protein (TIGR02217 family)